MAKGAVLAIWIVSLAVAGLVIARAQFTTDMSAFLPRAPTQVQRVLVNQIRDGAASRLLLVGIDGVPVEVSAALIRGMAARVASDRQFAMVQDGEISGLAADGKYLFAHRYLLSPAITPTHYSKDNLHKALLDDLGQLSSATGGIVKQTLPADPTGETLALAGRLADEGTMTRHDGVWTDAKGTMSLLAAQTVAPGSDLDRQEQALGALEQAFEAVRTALPGAQNAHFAITGPGVLGVHARAAMKRQTKQLSGIASGVVAALLLAAFRRPSILVLAFLPVASGVVAGIAAVALGFGSVHGITVGFGVTLIGEAVDYAIYYFTYAPGGAAGLLRLWPILRMGMALSVAGFAAMLFSGFTGFAQLGLFTMAGLVAAYLVARFVLPVLTPRGGASRLPNLPARLLPPPKLAWGLCGAVALASCLEVVSHEGPRWQDDITSLSPASAADLSVDRSLRAAAGQDDQSRYFAFVTGRDLQAVLQETETLVPVLDSLTGEAIRSYDAPTLILPSEQRQHERQAALPDSATLAADLQAASAGLPFQPGLFEPFLRDVQAARTAPVITPDTLLGTAMRLKFDAMVAHDTDGWTAMTSLAGLRDPQSVEAALAEQGAALVDLKTASNGLLLDYRREAVTLAACGSLAMTALLVAVLRKPARVAAVLLPLALAVLATTALSLAGEHRLSIFTIFGLLLTVAVGSNYCLFFERRVAGEPLALSSLALANLCTVAGFGILSFSAIPVLRGIGGTVAIGAFLSLVSGAMLIPPRRAGA